MKKLIQFIVVASVGVTLYTSCSSDQPKVTNTEEQVVTTSVLYQCPMKCEGDKTYEDPGTCPVCKMELASLESYPASAPDSLR